MFLSLVVNEAIRLYSELLWFKNFKENSFILIEEVIYPGDSHNGEYPLFT